MKTTELIKEICEILELDINKLLVDIYRGDPYPDARKIISKIIKDETNMNQRLIGCTLNIDRATVDYHLKKHYDYIKVDKYYRKKYNYVLSQLKDRGIL